MAERTLEERYNHAPSGFNATVEAYEIPGEPFASMIVREVCRKRSVWPGLLINGHRNGYVVMARRLIWRALYGHTDWSIENIAELFGYSPATVRPWATSWRPFEEQDPEWWRFWGPAVADSILVPLEAEGAVSATPSLPESTPIRRAESSSETDPTP